MAKVSELMESIRGLKGNPEAQRAIILANLNKLAPLRRPDAELKWWYQMSRGQPHMAGAHGGQRDNYEPCACAWRSRLEGWTHAATGEVPA